jgi:hypothetical protein
MDSSQELMDSRILIEFAKTLAGLTGGLNKFGSVNKNSSA